MRIIVLLMLIATAVPSATARHEGEHVILLHGLCRTHRSMDRMSRALEAEGYRVTNVTYPSRSAEIEELSDRAVGNAVRSARASGSTRIHFVTHSLGGILVRSYFARHPEQPVARVVMLGPPNRGSELVDRLRRWSLFKALNGPAGQQLGTEETSVPNRLGPVTFCVGVIAGNRSINWINSVLIPGPDDGKVSVARTRVDGMTDHVVIRSTHPMMMRNAAAIRQTIHFLDHGTFNHPPVPDQTRIGDMPGSRSSQ